jgi:hypothetical protein
VSTSQRVNKNCTKLKKKLMILYSSFVMNTLKKFPGAATVGDDEVLYLVVLQLVLTALGIKSMSLHD